MAALADHFGNAFSACNFCQTAGAYVVSEEPKTIKESPKPSSY